MVVRLQTADGKIRKYEVANPIWASCGDNVSYIDKYVTKCGREWYPGELNKECDHLGCAIKLAKQDRDELLIVIVILFILHSFYPDLLVGLYYIVAGILFIIEIKAWNQIIELNEYNNKGTIAGIMAWQIFDDQDEVKAKRWWHFWK